MSYRAQHGFGLGQGTSSDPTRPAAPLVITNVRVAPQLAAPTAAAQRQLTLDIIPYSCQSLRLETLGTTENPGPGQVAVMAWPYVTLDDVKVQAALDGIYGGGAGGNALIQATGQAITDRIVDSAPNFVASGWMRDAATNQAISHGTLWVAFAWPGAVSASAARAFGLLVVGKASGVPVQAAGSASATLPSPIGKGGIVKVAQDQSDNALQMAAVRSASATVGFFAALAAPFSGSPLNRAIALTRTTRQFNDAAAKVTAALAAAGQTEAIVAAAAVAGPAARDAAAGDACTAAVAALDATTAALTNAKAALQGGLDGAQWLQQYVQSETNPDGGAIVRAIRNEVVQAVDGAVAQDTMAVTKEYMKCLYFSNAKRSLDTQLKQVALQFSDAQAKAGAITQNRDAIVQKMALIDSQLALNAQSRGQSCLPWWQKDFNGVPVYAWLGGGATIVVGGAVAVRALRKRRAAAPTANARRRRARRTSRRTS